jgi:hypothetical protein
MSKKSSKLSLNKETLRNVVGGAVTAINAIVPKYVVVNGNLQINPQYELVNPEIGKSATTSNGPSLCSLPICAN